MVIMGNFSSNNEKGHTDQSINVGSSVDPPTYQNFVNIDESSCGLDKSPIVPLEGQSISQEKTTEMSKTCNASLNSHEKNEILDTLLHISADEKATVSPSDDVSKNIETLKEKKGDCSSINTFCKENYIDGVPIAFESKDSLSCASVESTLQKEERHVDNHFEYSCCTVENRSCIEESIVPNKQTKNTIYQMVQRCNKSLENLEKDHEVILNVMNSRSNSQNELKERGLQVTAELESIIGKLTARQKEKDDTISDLQFILSKLTEKVELLDQEIQVLKSTRKNKSDCLLQSEELERPVALMEDGISHVASVPKATQQKAVQDSIHQIKKALTSLNSFPLKPDSKPVIGEKSFSSENIDIEDASNETDQGNEDLSLCHSENNSVGSDVKIHDSVSETSVNPEQNVGEQDSEGQQRNVPRELDTTNIVGNSTRQPFDASHTLDTNVINDVDINQEDSKSSMQKEILPVGYWVDQANGICRMMSMEGPIDNDCGQCNVLCLDTSDSMAGEAFQTMINLSIKFLSGLEHSPLHQKVGLVCFGGYTGVLSRCCMNFTKLKQEIKNLRPGGSSPLSAGILLSYAVSTQVTLPTVQGIRFFPRIIVLTDGMATPETVTGCADFNPDMIERLKIRADIDHLTRTIRQSAKRIYFVPLGKADESFIEPLVRATHGKIIRPANFDKLIYQYEGELLAMELRPYFSNFRHVDPDMVMEAVQSFNLSLQGVEMEDLVEYVQNPPPQRKDDSDDESDNDDYKETDINMPPIGTRVRRGPDWQSNFDEQDSRGPGTVVSHDRSGIISIMWDNGHRYLYPYGIQGRFAVMVVDEPRVLQRDQLIEVGCLVKRGNNWRDNDNDGGPENIGVVFRVHSDATVSVRWPTGQRRRYKYGKQGYFEVQLCDPFDKNVQFRMLSMSFQDGPDENSTSQSRQADSEEVRIEDLVNSDDRETNPLEEMNKRNALRSTHTGGQSGPDTNRRQSQGSAENTGRMNIQGNETSS